MLKNIYICPEYQQTKPVKKIIFSALLCLNLLAATAQDIPCTIQKSEVFKDEYRDSYIKSVEDDGSGGVVIGRNFYSSQNLYGYYFEHYDANMKLINELKYAPEDTQVAGFFIKGDKIYIIEFNYDKANNAVICSGSTANLSDFKFTKKVLFSLTKKEFEAVSFFQNFRMTPVVVTNSSKTAFCVSTTVNDAGLGKKVHKVHIYDMDFNLKISHAFKTDTNERDFRRENIQISQDGTVAYFLNNTEKPDRQMQKTGGKYHYELIRVTANDVKTQVLETNEHIATSLKMIFKKDVLACVGFYSYKNERKYSGICYFDMDPVTLQVKTSKFNTFTEQFMAEKYGKDKDSELKQIHTIGMQLNDNNEIVVNAEETDTETPSTFSLRDNIIYAKLANNGDVIWARSINKRQTAYGLETYTSYTPVFKGNETFLFINTSEKPKLGNYEKVQFFQKAGREGGLTLIRIKDNGDFDYKNLFEYSKNDVPFMVSKGGITKQGNSIYFIGSRDKKKQLLKLTI